MYVDFTEISSAYFCEVDFRIQFTMDVSNIYSAGYHLETRRFESIYYFSSRKKCKKLEKKNYFVNQPLKLGIPCYVCTTIFKHIIGNVNLKRHSQVAEPLNSNKNHNILFVSVTTPKIMQK